MGAKILYRFLRAALMAPELHKVREFFHVNKY
jgi:hypothetical protein